MKRILNLIFYVVLTTLIIVSCKKEEENNTPLPDPIPAPAPTYTHISILFNKTYSHYADNYPGEQRGSIVEKADGGFTVYFHNYFPDSNNESGQCYLFTDAGGELQSVKYVSDLGQVCHNFCVSASDNNGYISSYSEQVNSIPFGARSFVNKVDAGGNIIWQKEINYGSYCSIYNSITAADGSIYSILRTRTHIELFKQGSNGDTLWGRNLFAIPAGCNGIPIGLCIYNNSVVTSGGFIDDDSSSAFLARVDFGGNIIYDSVYSHSSGSMNFENLCVANDGGYIVTGYYGPYDARKVFLMKFNDSNHIEWKKEYNTSVVSVFGRTVSAGSSGYISLGAREMYFIDNLGDIIWLEKYTYEQLKYFYPGDIIRTTDGKFALRGAWLDMTNMSFRPAIIKFVLQ